MIVLLVKYFVIVSSIILMFFIFYPRKIAALYYFVRPLAQPAANFGIIAMGIPITSFYSLGILSATIINLARKGPKYVFVKHSILLYLLLLFSSLSFLNTADYLVSLASSVKIITGLCFFLLIYSSTGTRNDALKTLKLISFSSVLPIFFGFYQYATGTVYRSGQVGLEMSNRINSFLGQANDYGIYLSLTLIATLIVFFHAKEKIYRNIFICLLALIVLSEIFAGNRGTWIALFIGFVISGLFFKNNIRLRWFLIVLLGIAVLFSNVIYKRFQELHEVNQYGLVTNTFAGRVNLWEELIPFILEHPLIGHGIGTSTVVTSQKLKIKRAPHNDYVRMALEIGIPGAFLYFLFLAFELIRNLKLAIKKFYWQVNYPILILAVYFIIISTTQNIISNLINFPLFTSLIAISLRMNEIYASELSRKGA